MVRACFSRAVVVACALAACSEDSVLVTIEGRDTVRLEDAVELEVVVEDQTGVARVELFPVSRVDLLGATLTIATTGRDGDIAVRVRVWDGVLRLLAAGDTSAPADGTSSATVLLEPAEFGLNDRVAGSQALAGEDRRAGAQLAVAADGTALAVWEGDAVVGRLFDQRARPADNAIEVTSLEFALASDPGGGRNPSVAHSADRWVAAWQARSEADGRHILARAFDLTNAEPVPGGDVTVATRDGEDQIHPDVFALVGGGFGVVWTRQTDSGSLPTELAVQLLDEFGQVRGPQVAVSAGDSMREVAADGVGLASGGFVVVWEDSSTIVARTFDPQAVPTGPDVALSSADSLNSSPRATALPDGGFAVVYLHSGGDGAYLALGAFDNIGAAVRPVERVAPLPTFGGVDIAVRSSDGAVAVVWADGGSSNAERDVFMRLYDAAWQPCTEPFKVNTEVSGTQRGPSVAAFGADAFLVAWTDESERLYDPSDAGAVARVVYPSCE